MPASTLIIRSRFCGPDKSGNGGYAARLVHGATIIAQGSSASLELKLPAAPSLPGAQVAAESCPGESQARNFSGRRSIAPAASRSCRCPRTRRSCWASFRLASTAP